MPISRNLMIAGLTIALIVIAASTAAALGNEYREAMALKPNSEHGRVLYAACAACHQPDGAGRARDVVPNIAGQHYSFVLEQLVDFRETERVDLRMNAAASPHALKGPQDLADVAFYVSSLASQPTDDTGPGQFLVIGQNMYARACSQCHGVTGEGNAGQRYPSLAGQHYGYLTRQIETMIRGDRPNISWDHMKLLATLTREEISGVAGYLARLDAVTRTAAALATVPESPRRPAG